MTLVVTAPKAAPGTWVEIPTQGQSPVLALIAEYDLPSCTAVAGLTTADMNAALASGAPEVCFPPGVYDVTGTVTQSADNQVLNFQPGAVLRFAASGLGKLVCNGVGMQIIGDPILRWDATSAVTYVAVDLHGAASLVQQFQLEFNADVANCTPIRISSDYTQIGRTVWAGSGGSFKYGVELVQQDGVGTVKFSDAGAMIWRMLDDGVHLRSFSGWVRYHSVRCIAGPLSISNGGRHFFNAIVEVDGQHNLLRNPQIDSSQGSNFGVLMKDDAEFFQIDGGEIDGNFLANSVGIACGDGSKLVGAPVVGQLKCFGTKITKWDIGVTITGTADSPGFFGATIANNKTAHVRIDSQRGSDIWPVSGLSFYNCYSEDVAFPGCPFLHLKTGQLQCGIISGGEVGYTGTAILVEATMNANSMQIDGGRWPAAAPTDAVTTPNTNSAFYFGLIAQSGSNLIGKGAFAEKAMRFNDPTLVGLVIGTHDTGTAQNRMTKVFTDIYTANFGNVVAGATVQLDFAYPGVPSVTTAEMRATMSAGLAGTGKAGMLFDWWIDAAGHIGGSATNITGSTINSVSGGVRFVTTVFG